MDSKYSIQIYKRIENLYKQRGLRQEDLAELAGVSAATLSDNKKKGNMRLEIFLKIAEVLKVHPIYLLLEESDVPLSIKEVAEKYITGPEPPYIPRAVYEDLIIKWNQDRDTIQSLLKLLNKT